MGDRAFADIGDDLHVGMGMGGKAGIRRDLVVVPNPQRAVAHIARVIVAAEREVMFCFQPAVIGAAEFCKGSEFDHGIFLSLNFPGWSCGFISAKTAIDVEHRAGHERGAGTGEEHDAGGDLFRGAVTLQRVLLALRFGEVAPSSGFMSVSIEPGCSTLTVMPRGPRSREAPLV